MYKLVDDLVGEVIVFNSKEKAIKEAKRRIEYYKVGSNGRYGKYNYFPNATIKIENNNIIIKNEG